MKIFLKVFKSQFLPPPKKKPPLSSNFRMLKIFSNCIEDKYTMEVMGGEREENTKAVCMSLIAMLIITKGEIKIEERRKSLANCFCFV